MSEKPVDLDALEQEFQEGFACTTSLEEKLRTALRELRERRLELAEYMVDVVVVHHSIQKLLDAVEYALATDSWSNEGEKARNKLADLAYAYREIEDKWEADLTDELRGKRVDHERERAGDVPPVQSALSDLPADEDGFRRPPIVRDDPDLYQKPILEPPTQPPGGGPGLPTEKK